MGRGVGRSVLVAGTVMVFTVLHGVGVLSWDWDLVPRGLF